MENILMEDEINTEIDLDGGDELEIEIVDPRPPEDRVEPRNENATDRDEDFLNTQELEDIDKSVEKRIKKLKYEYHEERRAKEEAQRREQAALDYARSLQDTVERGRGVLLKEVKARADSDIEKAKNMFKSAYEDGDADKVLESTEALQEASYTKMMADSVKEEEITPPEVLQQPQVDTRAEQWKSNNPWYGTDQAMTDYALGVHTRLINAGVNPMTEADKYYSEIDSAVKAVFADRLSHDDDEGENGASQPTVTPRRKVAPGNRTPVRNPRKVQLSESEVATAKNLGVPLEKYAAQKLKLLQGDN